MCIAFDVVHDKHRPVTLRQFVDRFLESRFQIRLRVSTRHANALRVIDVCFTLAKPLHLAQSVQHDGRRDGVQPRRKGGVATERAEPVECPDERFLGEILRECVVTREPERQAVHPIHMGVIERSLCGAVPGADAGYQLCFVHDAPGDGPGS